MPLTFRVTFSGLVNGNVFNNVLHIKKVTPGPTAQQDLATYVNTNWIDTIRTLQTNGTQYLNINVRGLDAGAFAPFNLVVNKLGTAISAAASDNPFTGAVLRLQTNVAGRTGRGRVHLCGISLGTSANLGILTAATLTAWQPKINAIKAAFSVTGPAGEYQLGVANRSDPVGSFKGVTEILVRANLGGMRSRNYGVGI
jgi:hypothetical protein